MTNRDERFKELFNELVPFEGKADSVAGEIVRAISRIVYRNYNDGDHIGIGYGKETCNAPARYLMENCGEDVKEIIENIWGLYNEEEYQDGLETLKESVLTYLDENPDLTTIKNKKICGTTQTARKISTIHLVMSGTMNGTIDIIFLKCPDWGY